MHAPDLSEPGARVDRPHAQPGATVDGRYVLRRLVARGGAGLVFEALHLFTKRITALKLLTDDALRSEESRERLMREAHALSAVRHPGFVDILDAGVCAHFGPYLVLEMLEGRPLDGILATRVRLPAADTVVLGVALARALAAAHARGIIHRDVKPSNVFVVRGERGDEATKLLDLGIASVRGTNTRGADRRLTADNAVLGTPEYMAPEQLFARDMDARADVYSLGVTLFECLTGVVPFAGTYPEVIVKVASAKAPPSARAIRPDVSPALDACLMRALAPDPDARFPNARAFEAALLATGVERPAATQLLAGDRTTRAAHADGASAPLRDAETRQETPGRAPLPVVVPGVAPVTDRRFVRAPYVTPVLLFAADSTPFEGRTEDISAGGMLVVARHACKEGTDVKLRFALPGSGEVATVSATVRWTKQGRGAHAIGLELVDVPPYVGNVIDAYIASAAGAR